MAAKAAASKLLNAPLPIRTSKMCDLTAISHHPYPLAIVIDMSDSLGKALWDSEPWIRLVLIPEPLSNLYHIAIRTKVKLCLRKQSEFAH